MMHTFINQQDHILYVRFQCNRLITIEDNECCKVGHFETQCTMQLSISYCNVLSQSNYLQLPTPSS